MTLRYIDIYMAYIINIIRFYSVLQWTSLSMKRQIHVQLYIASLLKHDELTIHVYACICH